MRKFPNSSKLFRTHHGQHELAHRHGSCDPLHRQSFFHQLRESQLLQHRRHLQKSAVGLQILSFEVVGCRSPDFIGLRDNFFSRLFGRLLSLCFFLLITVWVTFENQLAKLTLRGSSPLPQDFRGPQMGFIFRSAGDAQFLCISQLSMYCCVELRPSDNVRFA